MNSEELIITKDLIKRKCFLKKEFKKIIWRSVFQNFDVNKIIRIEMLKKLIFLKRKAGISRQNNVCILTGRIGGVFKNYNLSRHSIKRMAKFTLLTNTKINSW